MARILVVDDEEGLREFLSQALLGAGHVVETACDGEEALALLAKQGFDLVLTDLKMPGVDGLEVLRRVRADQPETEVVVLTAHGSVETAVEAMRLGAFDFLQKPFSGPDELRLLAERALERRRLIALREERARSGGSLPPLSHGDPAMDPVVEALERVAATEATVLLLGESGTGKELAARSVHDWSRRAGAPFVAINCAAISDSLLESELFGHEKGAFTGATAQRRGRIELASGGTFFLDEIGELKPELQAKLLRVLQEGQFERVGGARTLEADVRWIAATNRDLELRVAEGSFREDLFHRLAVFPVELPSLRQRRQDIAPLAESLLVRVGADVGKVGLTLTDEATTALERADWPGNVRELFNVLERAAILADGTRIDTPQLLLRKRLLNGQAEAPLRTLEEMEREAVERALAEEDGNRKRAAERLGIGLRTLYDKLKRYGLS